MQELSERDYRPPFITETDELRWDDCTVCSTLMASAVATLGETVYSPDWRPLNRNQLKALRERIRNHLPADKQTGPTSMADMRYAFAKEYPWLPDRIPFYDEQDNTWDEFMSRLIARTHVYVVMGNPALVKNPDSRLRRWTTNDNFGHAIVALEGRVRGDYKEVFIMDPLGRGEYDGEWVPASELKQFTWTFGQYVKVNGFPRGGWARDERRAATLIQKLRVVQEDLSDAQRAVTNITARLQAAQSARQAAETALEVAKNAAATAEAARAACQIALGNLESDSQATEQALEEANARLAETESALNTLNAQVQELEVQAGEQQAQITALEAERDGALERATLEMQRADTLQSQLNTCTEVNAKQAETLKRRWRQIQDLKKRLAECE